MFIFQIIGHFVNNFVHKLYVRCILLPGGSEVDYIRMGKRGPTLLIILGLGDSVRTVKDIAALLYLYFLPFAKNHQVIVMSRRRPFPKEVTIESFSSDYAYALEELCLEEVYIWGDSAGGPIAQSLALKQSSKIKGLILSKTYCEADPLFIERIQGYLEELNKKKFNLFINNLIPFTIKAKYLTKANAIIYRFTNALMRKHGKERVTGLLLSLMDFNQSNLNRQLKCPALVLVEQNDTFVPTQMQIELGRSISNATVIQSNLKREGHLISVKSYIKYLKLISDFIKINEGQKSININK